jgi:hypothetical protein
MYSSSTSAAEIAAMQGHTVRRAQRKIRRRRPAPEVYVIKKGAVEVRPESANTACNVKLVPDVKNYSVDALRSTLFIASKQDNDHNIIPLSKYMEERFQPSSDSSFAQEGIMRCGTTQTTSPDILTCDIPSISVHKCLDVSPRTPTTTDEEQVADFPTSSSTSVAQASHFEPADWSTAVMKIIKADETLHDLDNFCKNMSGQIYELRVNIDKLSKELEKTKITHDSLLGNHKQAIDDIVQTVQNLQEWQESVEDVDGYFEDQLLHEKGNECKDGGIECVEESESSSFEGDDSETTEDQKEDQKEDVQGEVLAVWGHDSQVIVIDMNKKPKEDDSIAQGLKIIDARVDAGHVKTLSESTTQAPQNDDHVVAFKPGEGEQVAPAVVNSRPRRTTRRH